MDRSEVIGKIESFIAELGVFYKEGVLAGNTELGWERLDRWKSRVSRFLEENVSEEEGQGLQGDVDVFTDLGDEIDRCKGSLVALLDELRTRDAVNKISEVTRRAIFDFMAKSGVNWAGRLPEDDFLARLYDLTRMPSTDHRIKTAAGDIRQHRIHWTDWEDDWVFYDSRFNLLWAPDQEFLRFLCETVHPVVRPNSDEGRELVDTYNRELEADGWRLIEGGQISGRPLFVPKRLSGRVEIFEEPTGWQKVDRQFQEVRLRLDTAESEEQYQAVGLLCREVLISVAQTVFDPSKHVSSDGVDPSSTDAKRMLESVFESQLQGSVNEEARAHAKAALRLALALQHKRTADFRMAALCAEATSSVVNQLAVLSGRRER